MVKIATPISHLFDGSKEDIEKIISLSDCLEGRDHVLRSDLPRQEVFHCELQPIHPMSESDFNYLDQIRCTKKEMKVLSFHMASASSKNLIKEGMFYPVGNVAERDELIQNARRNFSRIKNLFGNSVKVAVENNNYYPTPAYQYITDPDFISEVVSENNLFFLFDIAHAQISAANSRMGYDRYVGGLPMKRVVQIHICKPVLDPDGISYDAHNLPDEAIWEIVKGQIEQKSLAYLTVEYYRDVNGLEIALKRAREIIS